MALVTKNFSDIITFTRTGSTATYFNSAGVLTSAAADQPRFDYNPSTLAAQGLLIEEARTNSIRNNTMQGAVAGTPGTLPNNWQRFTSGTAATSIVGTGTESGITYVDVAFSGGNTDGISFFVDGTTGHAALNGQTWTGSSYYRLMAGSFANCTINHVVYEANSSGTALASSPTSLTTVTSAGLSTQRVIATRTNNNASTAEEQLAIVIAGTGAFSFTLRIGLPQLELGAFATSVIPTTTTALTRSADVASVNTLSPWYNATEGTLYAQASLISSSYTSGVLVDVGAGGAFGTTEYMSWTGSVWALGPNTAPLNVTSSVTTTSTAKVAAGIKVNDSVISANGLIGLTDTSCSIASAPTALSIGKAGWSGGANYFNGWIQRITYYPTRLSNAQLQALTV